MSAKESSARRRWLDQGLTWGIAVALFAGMLFWTKLRVVEPLPRQAYADPPVEQAGAAHVDDTGEDANSSGSPTADADPR